MVTPNAVLTSVFMILPAAVALAAAGRYPTYFVVKHSADGTCKVTTIKPRRRGYAIMGDLHFARKEFAERAAREHCKSLKEQWPDAT